MLLTVALKVIRLLGTWPEVIRLFTFPIKGYFPSGKDIFPNEKGFWIRTREQRIFPSALNGKIGRKLG